MASRVLHTGLSATIEHTVAESDTAEALRSGDVPVLATPRLIGLAEEASVAAVAGTLADGQTTVGMRIQIDHLAPTSVGGTVTAEAVLDVVDGRKLTFNVRVHDDYGLVAAGRITRVVVDRERFLAKSS